MTSNYIEAVCRKAYGPYCTAGSLTLPVDAAHMYSRAALPAHLSSALLSQIEFLEVKHSLVQQSNPVVRLGCLSEAAGQAEAASNQPEAKCSTGPFQSAKQHIRVHMNYPVGTQPRAQARLHAR